MGIDKDIDDMQRVIEGKCMYCSCDAESANWNHDHECKLYKEWIAQYRQLSDSLPDIRIV